MQAATANDGTGRQGAAALYDDEVSAISEDMISTVLRRKGRARRTTPLVRTRPTCHISCGASKRQKTRQSKSEMGPRIMAIDGRAIIGT